MTSLAEWNEQFGDLDFFPEKSKGYDWQFGVAYMCKVTRAKVLKSQKGDLQLELSIDIKAAEDDESPTLGTERQWLDLPMQESDKTRAKEQVQKMTARRFQTLSRIYAAAMPSDYAPYKELRVENGKKIYINFDDAPLSFEDYEKRKEDIQTKLIETTKELHGSEGKEIDLLDGTFLYIEKVENPKNDKYPYVNFFSTRPRNTPVYKHEDGDTPF